MCLSACLNAYPCTMWVQCSWRPEESIRSLRAEDIDSCGLLYGCWELNLSPLEVLYTAEPSLLPCQTPLSLSTSVKTIVHTSQYLSTLLPLTPGPHSGFPCYHCDVGTTGPFSVSFTEANWYPSIQQNIRVHTSVNARDTVQLLGIQ